MRAHEGAQVAADAAFGKPAGHVRGKPPFFVLRGSHGYAAVRRVLKGADRETVSLLGVHRPHNRAHIPGGVGIRLLRLAGKIRPGGRNGDLTESGQTGVHRRAVHVYYLVSLAAVRLSNGGLHIVHRLVHRQHAAELEKGGLQNAVGPVPQADGPGGGIGVDDIELRPAPGQKALDPVGEMRLQVRIGPIAVEEEGASLFQFVHNVILGDVALVVAGDKVRHGNIVGGENRRMSKAEMALRHPSGLLGVILKIGLDILVRVVSDNLDGVFVGSHGAVGPQPPEFTTDRPVVGGNHVLPYGQGAAGHIVVDTHGKMIPLLPCHVVVDGDHLSGSGILAGEAVPPSQDPNPASSLLEHGADVLVKRLSARSRLLGAV